MLDPPEVTPYDLRCASIKVNFWLKELTSKQQAAGNSGSAKKCLPTQFLLAVEPDAKGGEESDADSALSVELDSVRQDMAVQKAVLDAHILLLREAKASRQPRHVRKQRAADYQAALEKLSMLSLKARNIRDRMSNAEWFDDDSVSQSSSFAFCNGLASSMGGSSSAYGNSSSGYYSESLLSGQMYDARSLLSDLSRESSVRSSASANVPSSSSYINGSILGRSRLADVPDADGQSTTTPQSPAQPPPLVPRRSGLGPNAKSGSKWRRSNSMGNLLADIPPTPVVPVPTQSVRGPAPVNTSFPAELPPSQPGQYRRTSGADRGPSLLSQRYQVRPPPAIDSAPPPLSASQQSPYWYTPRSRLEPTPQQQKQQYHRQQYSDL